MLKSTLAMLTAAAALGQPATTVQAQPATPAGRYQVACSIQTSAGPRPCEDSSPARSCDSEMRFASRPSRESTAIEFTNLGEQPVKVYWLNFQGQRIPYNPNLAPGAQHDQQTFVGHNWLITTMTEQCLGIFETAPQATGDISAAAPPPPIPTEEQPLPPQDNLIWTPGYWASSDDTGDYNWVPGDWTAAPIEGYLWTPGYWFVQRGGFAWREGYWGPHVGFYGGVNYGYGYFGQGFIRGTWQDGRLVYARAGTYNAAIARVSYNGGNGLGVQPNAAEIAAGAEHHVPQTAAQIRHLHVAQADPAMRASFNNGHPADAESRYGDHVPDPAPPQQHAGTFSTVHAAAPPTNKSAPAAPPSAARMQRTALAPAAPAHLTQASAQQPAAPQEIKPSKQDLPAKRPQTPPHTVGHPP
jgi:hypothetical protein